MGDDYWNSSSVKKAVNRHAIFDAEDGNSIDVSVEVARDLFS